MASLAYIALMSGALLPAWAEQRPAGGHACATSETDGHVMLLTTQVALDVGEGIASDDGEKFVCKEAIPGSNAVHPVDQSYLAGLDRVERCTPSFEEELERMAANPGKHLFGDKGYQVPGYGGIATYDVVTTQESMSLYGIRHNVSTSADAYKDVWFVDSQTWEASGSFADYSNNVAATCWNLPVAIRCEFPAGTPMVVGSGGMRDVSLCAKSSGCDFHPGDELPGGGTLSATQNPVPSILQYIVHPDTYAGSCCVMPLNTADVPASFPPGPCAEPVGFGDTLAA